jgi:hypothetical protein
MTGTKTCNKCGHKNLGWDLAFNKKTGKWKLDNHKTTDDKWCNKPVEDGSKWKNYYKGKKADYVKCKLCTGNSGHCYVDDFFERHPEVMGHTLAEHTAMYHKNGEIRDEISMMILSDEQRADMRKDWNCPDPNI